MESVDLIAAVDAQPLLWKGRCRRCDGRFSVEYDALHGEPTIAVLIPCPICGSTTGARVARGAVVTSSYRASPDSGFVVFDDEEPQNRVR